MKRWTPRIASPWAASDLEECFNDALTVLDKVGIKCCHSGVRQALADADGIRFSGDRIQFAPASVRGHVEKKRAAARRAAVPDEEPEFGMGGCWAGLNYCDPETQDVRPASTEEAIRMVRLWDSRGLGGVVPLMPGDVPPELVTLTAERIALENSRYLGGSLTVMDTEEIRFLIDMNLAAGRRYGLVEQVGISPLQFNDEALASAFAFRENPDVQVTLTGSIPMAGATCPLDPKAAIIQSTAEALALDVLCSALGMAGGGLGIRVEPFDMQYAAIVFGSPEWCLYRVLVLQMNEYLTGIPDRNGMFRSVAKRPDPQAACERTASVLWQALLGVRRFGAVGQLSIDEVFSPQQAVIDREILAYVRRVIRGLDLSGAESTPLELIRQGIEEGTFIGVPDTVTRFRDFYDFPELFRHWNVGRWRAEHEPSILAEAWARAQEEIAQSDFRLEAGRHREVERIYRKARDHVQRHGKPV